MGLFDRLRPSADPESPYAEPEDYDEFPILTLRPWDYGQGLESNTAGYGFTTDDGKIWPAGKCQWLFWKDLGVLVINTVGVKYHQDDLIDAGFDPGQPLRLVDEPENPADPNALAIRDWTATKTAGYVKQGSVRRLRRMLRGEELHVMALSCRYPDTGPGAGRESLKVVIFRPGRLLGADHIPQHPAVG
jgi:hypothetical protein